MSRRSDTKERYLRMYETQVGKTPDQNAVGEVNRLMEKLLGKREFEWVISGKIIKVAKLLPKGKQRSSVIS